MLTRLYIANYALINKLEVDFDKGLTIITGETGAGKSIILGALSLILGGRADSSSIRDRSCKTIVEATFDITADADLRTRLSQADIDLPDGGYENELIVRREISATGRSRVFVNDGVVSLGVLKDIMSRLVDIHSQHNNMLLSTSAFQLTVLDSIAADGVLLAAYREQYDRYRDARRALDDFNEEYDRSVADLEYLTFQYNQLDRMMLRENEDDDLEREQRRLSNAGETREALWSVEQTLDGEERSVLHDLGQVAATLERVQGNLSEVTGMSERIREALIDLKDIAMTVSGISVDDDPKRLQMIEQRQNDIYELMRRHKVENVNALIALRDDLARRIEDVQNFDDRHDELEQALAREEKATYELARQLTNVRREAAKAFVDDLKPAARSLGMKNLEFEVHFDETALGVTGVDNVVFRFAFNKNQALMPVKDTASGGEISRLMLCVKAIIARSLRLPTIILDEVDTGVSGEIASKMGAMMNDIASRIQVITITHLPQVAAMADRHLLVFKHDTATETVTSLEALDDSRHVQEVARMLSGDTVSQAAVDNAKLLIAVKDKNLH